jgi:predicted nucleic acid-binding protein
MVVVLDASPLGLLSNPRQSLSGPCRQWIDDLQHAGRRVIVPEVADYEVRRELIRIGSHVSLRNLDFLGVRLEYLPLTTAHMRHGAELWVQARRAGKPTAPKDALDCDVLLAAQALSLNTPVIVATENIGHLAQFVAADSWRNIRP